MKRKKADERTSIDEREETTTSPVVALGASAGGLEPLQEFFSRMPPGTGMAFMVIQHLSSTSRSMLDDLLQKQTQMKVETVEDRMRIESNHVYLNPAGKHVDIFNGVFHVTDPIRIPGTSFPIDHFFHSLADDRAERAICIILSGTGTDGTLGLRAVKEAGGLAIVQEPQQAKFDGMLLSAIGTGLVDHVLPVEKMPPEIISYASHPYLAVPRKGEPEETNFLNFVQKILLQVRTITGSDFTRYKQNTIHRRIRRRMALHKIEAVSDYHRYLQESTTEVHRLFKELLILVTGFFRDPTVFEFLAEKVIPDILTRKEAGASVRLWVPGCATGEEVISLAMLLVEAREKLGKHINLQIFATDIDPDAIQRARLAEFPETIGAVVSQERLKRFFVRKDYTYKLKSELRDLIVFAVQDITSDAPFSRLDLISFRNVLIYMDTLLQKKVLSLFHYTLNPDGYLLLGTSESIGDCSDLFSAVDVKSKIFKAKKLFSNQAFIYPAIGETAAAVAGSRQDRTGGGQKMLDAKKIVEKVLMENYAPACVLIDEKYDVLYFQGQTGGICCTPKTNRVST